MTRSGPRVRVYKPKVKTGCITCKSRRVKCDETKPACLRCLKLDVCCGGYGCSVTKVKRSSRRQLLPQHSSSQDSSCDSDEIEYIDEIIKPVSKQLITSPVSSTLVLQTNVGPRFPSAVSSIPSNPQSALQFTPEEFQYFRYFREVTADHHTGYFECKLWDHVMLKTSEIEPFAKHAIIAVGALSKVWENSQSLTTESGISCTFLGDIVDSHSNPHYCFALKQYDKSIRLMAIRNSVQQDIRTTLLGCLLVICFENMVGNHYGALRQTIHGMKVLREWVSRNPNRIAEGIRPYEAVVESDVVDLFERYSRLFTEAQSLDPVSLDRSCLENALNFIPRRFKYVDEARAYFGHVCLRTRHLNKDTASSLDPRQQVRIPSSTSDPLPSRTTTQSALQYCTPSHLPLEKHAQQYTQLSEIMHLSLALQPLIQSSHEPARAHDYPVITALHISAVLGQILLLARCHTTELFYDSQLLRFREIIKLVTGLIDFQTLGGKRSHGDVDFKFKTGIVKPLFVVAARCRDWKVRMEALRLLRARKRRESIWDSDVAAAVAEWVIRVEGGCGEYVAEEKRVRIVNVMLEKEGRKAYVRAVGGGGRDLCGVVTW